jgi:HEPN domain-containing protein
MTPDYDVTTFETWRLKAEEDFTAASILAEHGGPAATICFLCQQVAEKYLVGIFCFAGNRRSEFITSICCSKTA